MNKLNWEKVNHLMPAIIQHADTGQVLMLGYMSVEALEKTKESGLVTFYSRTKRRLWVKGEESGNVLSVVSIQSDCDEDSLLILALPNGPTCHKGPVSCFKDSDGFTMAMMSKLGDVIRDRLQSNQPNSYCRQMGQQGIKRIAQKVGEEGVEVALAAVSHDRDEILNESADLIFHLQLLWQMVNIQSADVMKLLAERHKS
ncbi:bifunctional phosphoribosyl-AMP cyclohydrolase/phosphoribosyl-ATP diphosphatase HisIE [Legionella sp. W05-934-2]|jgi:phosphoribosyl-ATP pyrophosphohydrolase/phosphoribosyl-AMP cyclohydrolase|uniref:bifunctional phosphoribosyl-AMP cyclohydrolase/phosphoribosyl-ATP diphosphatase HisIE n=1 Tax=Legionella sp. W05-934-2 TaxID=1198649 RepID=UPI0034620DF8